MATSDDSSWVLVILVLAAAALALTMFIVTPVVVGNAERSLAAQHPGWPAGTIALIARGQVESGMSQEMVRLAWGSSYSIDSRSGTPGDVRERWVYEDASRVAYFRNGILYAFEDRSGRMAD